MTTKEMIEIMQAYDRGEQIEFISKDLRSSADWITMTQEPYWNWAEFDYRIKPKQSYRPYKNADEFLQAQKEHGIWLVSKRVSSYVMPVKLISQTIEICAINVKGVFVPREISFKELLNNYTWQDGTPCGIKE